MNRNTWGNTLQHTQQTETASIPSISRQISITPNNSGISQSSHLVKAALTYLSFSGIYTINNEALFIDSRKQEDFDWRKNKNAYQRIIHLSDLEDKWDSYNAPKFSQQQIDFALALYSYLRSYCFARNIDFARNEPFVAPCSDGMILFEWSGKRFLNKQLEIYVPISDKYSCEFLKTEGDSEVEGDFHLDESNLDRLYLIMEVVVNM